MPIGSEAMPKRYRKFCEVCDSGPFPSLIDSVDGAACPTCYVASLYPAGIPDAASLVECCAAHTLCACCGEYASVPDHRPPRKWRLGRTDVPSCTQCLMLVLSHRCDSLRMKRERVAMGLRRRYHDELNRPEWTEEELAELGYALQRDVRSRQELRDVVMARISFAELVIV